MEKIKISAREITSDIKSGLDDSELELKYNLSPDGLQYVLRRLVEADIITQFELYERTALTESDVMRAFSSEQQVFKCPVCGKTIPPHMDQCPNCEIISQKFESRFFIETLDIMSAEDGDENGDQDAEAFKENLLDHCRSGSLEGVKRLLELGANTDITRSDGTTPLMIAAETGNEEITDLLLRSGAKVNALDNSGASALIRASRSGHKNIVRLLLMKGATVPNGAKTGYVREDSETDPSAVPSEIRKTGSEGSRLFEFVSGDLTIKPNSRSNALLKACSKGRIDAVELLLKAGVHVDSRSKYGNTPLMRAAFKGHLNIVTLLLKMGADVNAENSHGNTALLAAALAGKQEIAELLLSKGANVNSANVDADSPLTLAAVSGDLRIAEMLLVSGANVDVKNNDWDTPLMKAADNDHYGMVKLLLNWGVDVNAANKYGNTALMKAAYKGNPDMVKLLLEKDAHKDARNNYGITAMMKAAYKGHHEVVALLLRHGADPTLQDKDGNTADDWARMSE